MFALGGNDRSHIHFGQLHHPQRSRGQRQPVSPVVLIRRHCGGKARLLEHLNAPAMTDVHRGEADACLSIGLQDSQYIGDAVCGAS